MDKVPRYTQDDLNALICCPKTVTDPPHRDLLSERGTLRSNARLRSQDGEHDFSLFIRINEAFPENFSIGLEYHPKDGSGSFCLLRCNGPHGEHVNEFLAAETHYDYHVHQADSMLLSNGEKAERHALCTKEYASYEGALVYFLQRTNIADADRYFPSARQPKLFDLTGET